MGGLRTLFGVEATTGFVLAGGGFKGAFEWPAAVLAIAAAALAYSLNRK